MTNYNRQTNVPTTVTVDISVLGVVVDFANVGSLACMALGGGEFQVFVTGAPGSVGDFLASSITSGVAETTGTGGFIGDFAIATFASTGSKMN